ncbi:hypothetical protein PQX77_014347 [Marasmius sp. AFHP31]|nr:hypothetical protein PQX77_014347 [Marasmius sp. AFHP31]
MQSFGKAALRSAKNYTQGYSDVQVKVRDATSNDPWGPTGQQMNEIAKNDFIEIIEILDKRLNDKGKNWRHVFKTLAVIDYCLLQGSEDVVRYYKENIYMIKTLREFQFLDDDGNDQGGNVRQRAKDITNLLMDDSKIRSQRRSRADARDRMRQVERGNSVPWDQEGGSKRSRRNKEDDDLQRAIEESKKSMTREQETAEDKDLQRAIQLSQEDESNRSKSVDDANANALFDDQNQLPSPNANQFSNNPFPMTMNTGLQPQFLQPQFTQMQPQFTSFNPYQQQMQEAAQAEYLRQQEAFQQQQQQAAFQAQQQQQQEEWMRQQMMMQQQQQQQQQQFQLQQQQSLSPQSQFLTSQPTGFGNNNPFARNTTSPGPTSPQNTNPPMFNIQGTYESGNHMQTQDLSTASSFRTPSPNTQAQQANRPIHVKTKQDENQELANLFADRDGGQDTFGNVGMMRYGHTGAGRMVAQQSQGNNPFAKQQQQGSNEQPFFSI